MSSLRAFFLGLLCSVAFSYVTGIVSCCTIAAWVGALLSPKILLPVVVVYLLFILAFAHIAFTQELGSFNVAHWSKVAAFAGLWSGTCCIFMLAIGPLWVVMPEKARMIAHRTTGILANIVMQRFAGWKVSVEGLEKLPSKPVVFVLNHQSMVDIGLFILAMPIWSKYVWVSKDSLFWAPGLGALMHIAGYVPLKRRNKNSIQEMFSLCHTRLREGWSVVIFPSGTRRRHEQLPFKAGGFQLAYDAGVPVVPVSLQIPADVWTSSGTKEKPIHLKAIFHDPITTHLDASSKDKSEKEIVMEMTDLGFKAVSAGLGPNYFAKRLETK